METCPLGSDKGRLGRSPSGHHRALFLWATLVFLLPGAAVLGAPPKVMAKITQGYVAAISMDGPLVAYDVEGALQGPPCNRLFVWHVHTGSAKKLSGQRTCSADDSSTGAGVSQIAVAGSRAAWLVNQGGNTESTDDLYTASLAKPKEVLLASTRRTGDVDCVLTGRVIGGLVGDTDVLAVNMWSSVAGDPDSCDTNVENVSLRTIGRTSTRTIATGTDAWLADSADLGRIAVRRADGTVALYTKSGRLLRAVTPSSVKEVALRKDYVVVLTTARTLEVFSAVTGSLLFTRKVAGGAAHLDVHAGLAVYTTGRRVRTTELATGKSAVVATAPRDVIALALEAPGAVYAYNSLWTRAKGEIGNLVFLRLSELRAALS
ncbi:MAG TPA: hypothetical protein VFR32_01680 [Gaiellaceae bacterium]|nr:hypothetical protein [Gaiellaceae bacterium]